MLARGVYQPSRLALSTYTQAESVPSAPVSGLNFKLTHYGRLAKVRVDTGKTCSSTVPKPESDK
jgi:hypothetical protein